MLIAVVLLLVIFLTVHVRLHVMLVVVVVFVLLMLVVLRVRNQLYFVGCWLLWGYELSLLVRMLISKWQNVKFFHLFVEALATNAVGHQTNKHLGDYDADRADSHDEAHP